MEMLSRVLNNTCVFITSLLIYVTTGFCYFIRELIRITWITTVDHSDVALRKKLDQGHHECEVLADEAEASHHWKRCTKNPGHHGFIPAPQLSMTHLPAEYQDKQLFEYIRYLSELTVRLVVRYTSTDRPAGYPFAKFGGQHIPHTGSGCVRFAGRPYELKVMNRPCPCTLCEQSGSPKKLWWDCTVMTAKHVVFNNEEARETIVEAFYDDENHRDKVKVLYGISVIEENKNGDRCELKCITHEREVAERLRYAVEVSLNIHRAFSKGRYPTLGKDEANLCVVVSHPHGCSKHISIGHWKKCLTQGETRIVREFLTPWYESYLAYTYDTPTCPGSSGGSVCILGMWDERWSYILAAYYFCHTHKAGRAVGSENLNESCYWLVSAE